MASFTVQVNWRRAKGRCPSRGQGFPSASAPDRGSVATLPAPAPSGTPGLALATPGLRQSGRVTGLGLRLTCQPFSISGTEVM